MERLAKYPELNIAQVAKKLDIPAEELRDAQLEWLRKHVKRDSKLWNTPRYGR